jgi:hypothetical protein
LGNETWQPQQARLLGKANTTLLQQTLPQEDNSEDVLCFSSGTHWIDKALWHNTIVLLCCETTLEALPNVILVIIPHWDALINIRNWQHISWHYLLVC